MRRFITTLAADGRGADWVWRDVSDGLGWLRTPRQTVLIRAITSEANVAVTGGIHTVEESTGAIAKSMDPDGMLYQRRALVALPILVRQARAGQTIYYSDLAAEMGMPNPRNLNFVLGSVGTSLNVLSREWKEPVPPLQALVINRADELPGEGFSEFAPDPAQFRTASRRIKQQVTQALLSHVFTYRRWPAVLKHFGVHAPPAPDLSRLISEAERTRCYGAGESKAHATLKEQIAASPALIGFSANPDRVIVEYAFPSADTVDVLIEGRDEVWAVEVKSHLSDDADLLRGIFQAVKYRALLSAELVVEQREKSVRSVLVTERALPLPLQQIALTLGVPVHVQAGAV